MAIDEAMLRSVLSLSHEEPGCNEMQLRFYQWTPRAVSLGRYQRSERYIDLAAIAENKLDLVRRPTGGKALIHDNELTYCLVVPPGSMLSKLSVSDSHKVVAEALVEALSILGLHASLGFLKGSGGVEAGNPCFKEHLTESVIIDSRKVAGSAQLRSDGAILQHGSIILSLDYLLHRKIFGRRAEDLEDSAAGLFDLSEATFTIIDLESTIAGALSAKLCEDISSVVKEFPHLVRAHAEKLRSEKYCSVDWPDNTAWRNCNG
jgi:lipoate-protein ligase A